MGMVLALHVHNPSLIFCSKAKRTNPLLSYNPAPNMVLWALQGVGQKLKQDKKGPIWVQVRGQKLGVWKVLSIRVVVRWSCLLTMHYWYLCFVYFITRELSIIENTWNLDELKFIQKVLTSVGLNSFLRVGDDSLWGLLEWWVETSGTVVGWLLACVLKEDRFPGECFVIPSPSLAPEKCSGPSLGTFAIEMCQNDCHLIF